MIEPGTVLGEFALKAVTFHLEPAPVASMAMMINMEGNIVGFGDVYGTLTMLSAGQKTGTWTWSATSFAEDGASVSGSGEGIFASNGANRWSLTGFINISDGRRVRVESEFKLSLRRWAGKYLMP
jgi:hypothetical protein